VGTAGADAIQASHTSTTSVLGALDSIDGGAGVDTLSIAESVTAANADFQLPTGFTVKNVEKINVTTNAALGTAGGTAFDVSTISGLTDFTGIAAGAGTATGSIVKAAATTNVALTVSGNNTITVSGGKAVTTNSAAAGTGAVGVTGSALTSVTVNGGGTATIDNESTAAVSATGTTLTSVTLNNDATGAIKGAALATVSLSGQGAGGTARTVTLTNGTSKALTINANGTGYQNNAAATEKQTVFTQAAATATSVTVNTTAKSSLDLTGITTLTSVALTGAGALTFKPMGSSVLSLDGSAATGNLTLGTLDAALVTLKTGAGKDTATLSATTKASVATGAGNDTLTLGAALAAGSTVDLGAGDDTLSGTTAVAASSGANVTVVDGGDGVDSISSGVITAGNAAQFKNFENVSIQASVDASLLTASTITGLTIDGSTGTSVVSGITQAQGLTVKADNGGTSSTLTFTGVTGTADAYSIGFAATTTGTAASPTSIDAKIVGIEGIENVTINSAAAAGVVTNAIALKGTTGRTVTITGDQALNLTFNTAFGDKTAPKTGVSSIDGSAATGKLGITLTNVVAATAGLTVKGGSADDTITTIASQATTLTGGAGKDSFVVGATVYGGSAFVTTITDFANSGDKITFADKGTETWTSTKKDVSAATTLATALGIAIGTANGSANGAHAWFQYGGNTYIVECMTDKSGGAGTDASATDLVVKLTGLVDLSTATFAAGAGATLTLA
jgi:S-layer protein